MKNTINFLCVCIIAIVTLKIMNISDGAKIKTIETIKIVKVVRTPSGVLVFYLENGDFVGINIPYSVQYYEKESKMMVETTKFKNTVLSKQYNKIIKYKAFVNKKDILFDNLIIDINGRDDVFLKRGAVK